RLEQVFAEVGHKSEGYLVISDEIYTKSQRNIEEEIWSAVLTIRNNAPISSNCNIFLKVFNSNGSLLDEYLLFNDMLGYESTITHRDEIYIKSTHLGQISFARYHYNCVKKDILGGQGAPVPLHLGP
ncbi:MAG: hypothetical protein KAR83_03515, partial [Thermodesulfovibrionales bacterium]|nr:hypothetical protein [Thermodesulfovibrionales bacterium]